MLVTKLIFILLFYIFMYYSFGVLFNKITRNKDAGIALTFVAGMFFYATVYFVYVMPFKLKNYSVEKFSKLWGVVCIVALACIIVAFRKTYLNPIKKGLGWIKQNKLNFALIALIAVGLILYIEIFGYLSYSHNSYDYIAYPNTAIINDVAGVFDNQSGLIRGAYDSRQLVQTFLDHSATIGVLFSVNPIIEIRDVFPAIVLVVEVMTVWMLAMAVCKDNKPGQFLFFTIYQAVWIGSACSVFLSGYYGLFRICEGKNVYASLTVPLGLYVTWKLIENPKDWRTMLFGFVGICGSLTFTGAALFVWPVAMIGVLIKVFSKDWKWSILNYVVMIMPCVAYGLYYYGTMKGKIDILIHYCL